MKRTQSRYWYRTKRFKVGIDPMTGDRKKIPLPTSVDRKKNSELVYINLKRIPDPEERV